MIRAIILDFDGVILETERPSYQSWLEVYQSFGQQLPLSTWSVIIGTTRGAFNPRLELERLVNGPIDWQAVEGQRLANENALIEAQPILPGVENYLDDAIRMSLRIGLASNSSRRWVVGHLRRIGLAEYFDCICTADDIQRLKPDPEVYFSVLRGLGVSAEQTIALEDSPIGIRSAKAAGVYCVAVPNEMTRQLDLALADFQLTSLMDMPISELLQRVNSIKTQGAAH